MIKKYKKKPVEIEATESYEETTYDDDTYKQLVKPDYEEESTESRDIVFDSDIEAMMSRANMLRQDLANISDQIAAAEQDSASISADYADAYGKFSAYVAGLQSQRDSLERKKEDIVNINNDRRAQVDAIMAMMENQPVSEETTTKHR